MPANEGGSAATGSSRYSFTTSALIGTEAQKYPNVLLRGITSPLNRSANCPTLTRESPGWAGLVGVGSRWLDMYFFDLDSSRESSLESSSLIPVGSTASTANA